jgi:hypothetical protein
MEEGQKIPRLDYEFQKAAKLAVDDRFLISPS